MTLIPKPPETWPERGQDLYFEYAQQRQQRSRHTREYLRQLSRFLRFQAEQGFSFRDFPQHLVESYLDAVQPRQQRKELSVLRPWMRFLYRRKELLLPVHEDYPGSHLPHYGRRSPLSHEQILQAFELFPLDTPQGLRDRAILEVAYGTAMRREEIINLELPDVDLAEGWVFLRDTKNNRQRKVPLTRWAWHFLKRYLAEARPLLASPLSSKSLWLNRFGQKLHLSGINQRLSKVYRVEKTLGFAFTPHQLRHSAATHLLTAGASLRVVQELLNHAKMASTAHYTHLTPQYLKDMHERFHPRNHALGAGIFDTDPNSEE